MFTLHEKSGFRWKNQRRRQDKSPFSFREQSWNILELTMQNPRSPRDIFNFENASSESSGERRIFQFDESSLNSNSSGVPTFETPSSGGTIIEGSSNAANLNGIPIPGQGNSIGIYEDHPGLNPVTERVVEYQAAIHQKLKDLMPGRNSQEVLAAAERVHGESNDLSFMAEQLQDLVVKGVESEAFKIGVQNFPRSPLDQFAIHPLIDLNIGNYFFSFTNLSLSMLLTLVFVLVGFFFVTKKGGGKSVPNAWQSLVEQIYDFVLNLVNEQIGGLSGNVKQKFFPCISVTFTFSLFRNPQGMIPFSFTVTSHFLITLALSFSLFIGITIVGFQRHGLHFFSFLLPAGVPLPLAPFLVLLELISHCFRALSSGIRLFANMMAGHSLVKILSGFAWTMLFLNNIFYFIGDLGPLFIVLALTGLELGVAISQAHVSTISICIYLNDAINLH